MTDLPTRRYGRTGYDVTPLCIGSGSWGATRDGETETEGDERIAEISTPFAARALPVNFLDSSNIYGGGRSELLVGRGLARAKATLADQGAGSAGLVVQTKLDRDVATGDFSADRMRRSLDETLERLGVDHLQVLHLHDPDSIGFEAAMADGGPVSALVTMKEEGVVSSIGISGGPVGMLQRFVETDLFDALITHNRWTLVDRSASALFDAATARDVGITNGAPYGAGILTGDPRFAGTYAYRPATQQVLDTVTALQRVCDDFGVPLGTAALQFSVRERRIHSTVVGVSSLPRLEAAIDAATQALPDELWAALDAVVPEGIALDA
ncbi:aldo/keto reductase [Frondihabitans australicus]|uniref:D-threo-aldose 1-dehydrogenase n=1 Tax=Frondihabitans australicus TaxID=386892 RepID=A0A495IJG3_9MICO|nr:aldo/keto reductase [Frondihabitans australicus]RKR75266.1 D-threo-aldose 1-dehydrogenase [Frondihabitans australicus]